MSGIDAAVICPTGAVDELQEIEILEALGEPTRFRYRVAAPVADGDIPALAHRAYDPGTTALIVASRALIMRGIVTGQRAHLSGDSETSWVDVLGADRSVEMGREAKLTAWQFARSSDVVTLLCSTYGMIPNVAPTSTVHTPLGHELVQRGTDLTFIRRLARRNGCLFWISLTPVGVEVANFQPPPVSAPAVASLMLHGPEAAVDELDIEWDTDRPTSLSAMGLDPGTLATIDASVTESPVAALASERLAAIGGGRSGHTTSAGDDAASLSGPAQSLLIDADFFITATATTTVARAGRVLHAHDVVQLDGLGRRHSGRWLISEVRHLIDAVSHRMQCTFARNGWES